MTFLKYVLVGLTLSLPLLGAHAALSTPASATPAAVSLAEPHSTKSQKKSLFSRLKHKATTFWNALKRKVLETQDELIRLLIIALIVALIVSIVVWLLPWPLDVLIMIIALVFLLIFLLRYLA